MLQWLIKEVKNIIFVLNDFQKIKKSDIIKLTEVPKDPLIKIISSIPNNKYISIDNYWDNFVSIN